LRELSARRTNVHSLALSRLSYSELGRLTMVLSMLDASLDKAAALAELDVDNEFTEN
jgi:GTP-sensing pleiotropic transcriptional regulator CodY